MGAKLTRLQDTVNNTRQRVSSSLAKRTSSSRASNGAVADLEDDCCSDGSKGCNGEDAAEDHHTFDVSNHETGHDPAVHGAKLEDRNYNNEIFKKRSVDPHDPQQQQAAVTIQSQYRQHSAKSEVKAMREEDAATRIQAGFRGFIDREQVRSMKGDDDAPEQEKGPAEEEQEVDIDLNDPEVEKAAIKIQAGFKGFKARKDVSGSNEDQAEKKTEEETPPAADTTVPKEEEVDIDLEDPATEKAALKIQASFRGFQTRRDMGEKKQEGAQESSSTEAPSATQAQEEGEKPAAEEGEAKEQEEEVDIDLEDPEVEKAALKIQAGFKGLKARKELQDKKPGGETDTVDGAPAEETSAADEGSKVEGEGQEEVKASEEETQPKVVEGQGDSQQQEGEEQQPPAEAAAAEGEQAAGEVKGDE